ncbi:uncharacterized protein Nnf1a [Palaemon carinicauda]|uniref:uncharacterized protein Nnf1a n=1 Tax=Palaemon carinicauda TaxID=392227 RepID=UPI0035B5AAC9
MTFWIRSKDPFNSEGGIEEKMKGGPPEEKEQKREEVEKKENENVQKPLKERISSLEKELEAAFAEISSRKEKLENVRHNKRKLEKFVEKKMEVIEQISEQRLELQKSLDEARINDLIRNGRYKCLLQELETLKKENLNKLSDFEQRFQRVNLL